MGTLSMSQFIFKVSLIGCGGELDKRMQGVWVSDSVRSDMICAKGHGQKPKPKFAYDHISGFGPYVRHTGVIF